MKPYEIIAATVRERGITKAELARRTGLDSELLRRSLNGTRKLHGEEFLVLCFFLELKLGDFEILLP